MIVITFVRSTIFFLQRHLILLLGGGLLVWVLGVPAGWLHTQRLQNRVQQMQRSVAQLAAERDQLVTTIRQYQATPFMHEKTAREWLQLGRSDEIVYRV